MEESIYNGGIMNIPRLWSIRKDDTTDEQIQMLRSIGMLVSDHQHSDHNSKYIRKYVSRDIGLVLVSTLTEQQETLFHLTISEKKLEWNHEIPV